MRTTASLGAWMAGSARSSKRTSPGAWMTAQVATARARRVGSGHAFRFLDPAARDFFPDFDESAGTSVQLLRAATRTTATSPTWSESCAPAAMTSAPAGPPMTSACTASGSKKFRHPVVGELALGFEAKELSADSGLTLTAYTAEPGSPSAVALRWTPTVGGPPMADLTVLRLNAPYKPRPRGFESFLHAARWSSRRQNATGSSTSCSAMHWREGGCTSTSRRPWMQ